METTAVPASHNMPEYSVSEVAGAIKQSVEDRFGYVRVRGEISGWKLATSGHAYFRLKDDAAVLDAVIWKGTLSKLGLKPEDGLEVVISGRITTYPGKSSYQIIADKIELAGAGALMALLEARKQKLAAEGLFDASRKLPLPYLPEVIGVVTSPTGAVIRDILHRIEERFPCRVLVWPVLVQGEQAAVQIAAAIEGFNALPSKPDLLIVARGGGSLEDLWAFNEEIVVRAAAASKIPLISAVGHETDTTLIDFVSSRRAPTPTAAAEIAVPVKRELELQIAELNSRLQRGMIREFEQQEKHLQGLLRGLPKPERLLELAMQRLDVAAERLHVSLPLLLARKVETLKQYAARLATPERMMETHALKFTNASERLHAVMSALLNRRNEYLTQLTPRLKPEHILRDISQRQQRLLEHNERLHGVMQSVFARKAEALTHHARLLKTVSFEGTLARGFALVKTEEGKLVSSAKAADGIKKMSVQFADGIVKVHQET